MYTTGEIMQFVSIVLINCKLQNYPVNRGPIQTAELPYHPTNRGKNIHSIIYVAGRSLCALTDEGKHRQPSGLSQKHGQHSMPDASHKKNTAASSLIT